MATPNINVSQGGANVVVLFDNDINVSMASSLVVANFPSEALRTSQAGAMIAATETNDIRVSQAAVLVVGKGRVGNPNLKAWGFDLDAHELYVLKLGDGKTLVYDLSTEQWSWWSSGTAPYWRASLGTNWVQSGSVGSIYGSNVVVGDDATGILWTLNPEKGFDDSTSEVARANNDPITFPRVATGQVITKGRITIPCYQVYLTANTGEPAFTGASVTLSYSDDQGKNFVTASQPIVAEAGNYYQEFAWRSIGLVKAPGRLFRIEDNGAFSKIEELSISEAN